MVEKRVVWSERAETEFRSILEFYIERNGSARYSLKIVTAVEKLFRVLLKNNYLGRLSDNKKTRVINMDVFLVFYELSSHRIEIVSFWDNRQAPEKRIDKK
jgi:plasmid stabilization system protein ParE